MAGVLTEILCSAISSLSWVRIWDESGYSKSAPWIQRLLSSLLDALNALLYALTGGSYMKLLCEGKLDRKGQSNAVDAEILCQLELICQHQILAGIDLDNVKAITDHLRTIYDIGQADNSSRLNAIVSIRQAMELELLEMEILSAAITFWDGDVECQRLCTELHTAIYEESYTSQVAMPPRMNTKSKQGLNWTALGFQGLDPTTDFRGMGKLGLRHFHVLCVKEPGNALEMIIESGSNQQDMSKPQYSFALVSIHISRYVLELLESKVLLRRIVNAMHNAAISPGANLEDYRNLVKIFTDTMHLTLLREFHVFWRSQVAAKQVTSIMDVEATLDRFKRNMSRSLFLNNSDADPGEDVEKSR